MKSPLAVIAIGGNSLILDSKKITVMDQYRAASETAHHIAALVAARRGTARGPEKLPPGQADLLARRRHQS